MGERIETKTVLCYDCDHCSGEEPGKKWVQCMAFENIADGRPGVIIPRRTKCKEFRCSQAEDIMSP